MLTTEALLALSEQNTLRLSDAAFLKHVYNVAKTAGEKRQNGVGDFAGAAKLDAELRRLQDEARDRGEDIVGKAIKAEKQGREAALKAYIGEGLGEPGRAALLGEAQGGMTYLVARYKSDMPSESELAKQIVGVIGGKYLGVDKTKRPGMDHIAFLRFRGFNMAAPEALRKLFDAGIHINNISVDAGSPPPEVKKVADIAKKSAKDGGAAPNAVSVSYDDRRGSWSICDNYERYCDMILDFDGSSWSTRWMYSDRRPEKISQDQAEAEAELMFHG